MGSQGGPQAPDNTKPFREQALDRLRDHFGTPMQLPAGEGRFFYRWILERPHGLSIYITLDSPEIEYIAHLIVSDPRATVEPVEAITLRTLDEVNAAAHRILKQWRNESAAAG